jgi:hypothetical protein
VDAAVKAFFGEKIMQIDPKFLTTYFEFEKTAWKLFYHYPSFMAKDFMSAQKCMLKTMSTYFNMQKEERQDMAWVFQTMEAE